MVTLTVLIVTFLFAIFLDLGLMLWIRRRKTARLHSTSPAPVEEQIISVTANDIPEPPHEDKPAAIDLQEEAPTEDDGEAKPSRRGAWLELGVIFLIVTLFCVTFLDFRADTQLTGNESELFQTLDWTLVNSLKNYRQFPLWNPFIATGIPFIADPMLHVYNPVVTLPVLLFGVRDGFKLAVYLSFLLAGIGMWKLGGVLGLGRWTRLWMALTYTFAGQPVARFFQGQYLFIMGFAWIPWFFSWLILTARTKKRIHALLAALALALLFFSGNVYYTFYILVSLVIFACIFLPEIKNRRIRVEKTRAIYLAAILLLALGLVAVQLYPLIEFQPRLSKAMDLAGSHTLKQIFLDYTSKDTLRPDAYQVLPAREEYYAYIGYVPLLALFLVPMALRGGDKKLILFFVLILVFCVIWIDLDRMPWRDVFKHISWLVQFRHLLRVLVIGSFAIILLAGMGADALLRQLKRSLSWVTAQGSKWVILAAQGSIFCLGIFMLMGVIDVFQTNRQYAVTQAAYKPAYRVVEWVREHDLSDYYIRPGANNIWQEAIISHNLRYIDAWYHFTDIRNYQGMLNQRAVQAKPNYFIQPASEPPPDADGAELAGQVEGYNIFWLGNSLPIAFSVKRDELKSAPDELVRRNVIPQTPFFANTDRAEVIAEGQADDLLVLLMTKYPGWQVTIDSRPAEILNISGYMATAMEPGVHRYVFTFNPRTFYTGLVISLVTLGLIGYWLGKEVYSNRSVYKEGWRTLRESIRQTWRRSREWTVKGRWVTGAVYNQGVFLPAQPPSLEEGAQVQLVVETAATGETAWRVARRRWLWATGELTGLLVQSISLDKGIFLAALALYLLTHFSGLTRFPIYFFTDEAIQTVAAADLIQNHFKGPDGSLLPTYFKNGPYYNLSASVYLQALPYLLFGKSVVVTRGVSVLVSLLAAIAVGLISRNIFNLRYWWVGTMLLAITPAWFLHSRTAFETVIFVSFYAIFLYFYGLYRYHSPRYLYASLVFAGLAFYSYSPGQLVMLATGVFLFFSDILYHWRNRGVVLRGLGLGLILALPYLRFRLQNPFDPVEHLRLLGSYLVQPLSWQEKITRLGSEYLKGLSPGYWYFPNEYDLPRHLMKGYGNILRYTLPFALLGLGIAVWKIRSANYRIILAAFLAAPLGGALVGTGITRDLVFVIPAAILSGIGLARLFEWLEKPGKKLQELVRGKLHWLKSWELYSVLSWGLFILLALTSLSMLRDALRNGPTWYDDYGLGGMQYGAQQLFSAVQDYHTEHPQAELIVSPSWSNGTDVVARYFLPEPLPITLGSIEGHISRELPLDENMVFVMIPYELQRTQESGKFTAIHIEQIIYYPDGQPGFYFVRLKYAEDAESVFEAEQEERRQLQEGEIDINGETVIVGYSMLDMGVIQQVFDGNLDTLARTLEANPFVIELHFPEPREIKGYEIKIGSIQMEITTRLYATPDAEAVEYKHEVKGAIDEPVVRIDFGSVETVQVVVLEIRDKYAGEPANVHVWEINFY